MIGYTEATGFYMAAVVVINDECGLRIKAHHRNKPNNSKLSLYKVLFSLLTFLLLSHLTFLLNGCTQAT